jgi:hypothetical protein
MAHCGKSRESVGFQGLTKSPAIPLLRSTRVCDRRSLWDTWAMSERLLLGKVGRQVVSDVSMSVCDSHVQ